MVHKLMYTVHITTKTNVRRFFSTLKQINVRRSANVAPFDKIFIIGLSSPYHNENLAYYASIDMPYMGKVVVQPVP